MLIRFLFTVLVSVLEHSSLSLTQLLKVVLISLVFRIVFAQSVSSLSVLSSAVSRLLHGNAHKHSQI